METSDYEHGVVPIDQRKSWLSIAAVWVAIGIDLSGAFLGIELANGMEFWPAFLATMVASVLLGLLAMGTAYVGASTGLSSAMISRAVFGKAGGVILALVIAVSMVGWFAVQAGFFGENAQVAFASLTGIELPVQVFTGIGGVLMGITAFWGYRSINRLSTLAVPLLLLLLLGGLVIAFITRGANFGNVDVEPTFSFGLAVSLVMGSFILGVVLAPDMARWARTPKQAMGAGFVGFFFGNSLILIIAMIFARVLDETQLMAMFFTLGLGGIAVVVLILAQWTTNTTNLYSSGLAFSSISSRLNRGQVTIGLGVVAIVLGVLGAVDHFVTFLLVIGTLIAPYGGVYLASFFLEGKSSRWLHEAKHRGIDVFSVAAWVVGVMVAFATTPPAEGPGFGWFTLTTIPVIDGLIASFAMGVVLILARRNALRRSTESVDTAPTGKREESV